MRVSPVSLVSLVSLGLVAARVDAAPPEPRGPHPRILLDAKLKATWRQHAQLSAGPVIGAIRLCERGYRTREHDRALYQGSEWARLLQACLVAYAATERDDHAAGAIKFFEALLDDLDTIDDARGGDQAARRDSGYAIRNLGPYTALAYDWLHDHPRMTTELEARARQRWKGWLDWYRDHGYRASHPGSNYHAGYLAAATLIAIAQAGEAGADGTALWTHVADQMWGVEMRQALSRDGILAGGNWPEGWQYGPLSVAEYALAARAIQAVGVEVPGIATWLSSVLRHHVYALSPGEGLYAGGDTEATTTTLAPHVLTLDAVALGDASAQDRAWARGELARLRLTDRDWFLYGALATVGEPRPQPPPRTAWPTWYVSANTGTLYARTRWDADAVWFVAECQGALETDHRHANAGTFALSRGRDDVIVDPTPYGSRSTLTTNAPTVVSPQLPFAYQPSQGTWGDRIGYDLITQRRSGVVAARCNYADAYRFQHRPSDVPEALRDFVLVPTADGRDAALVVIDRARTGSTERGMYLRFRTPGRLALAASGIATATIGATRLTIAGLSATPAATLGVPSGKDCFDRGTPRGRCEAARLPVTDYRVQIAGPTPTSVHVLTVRSPDLPAALAAPLEGRGGAGIQLRGLRDAAIVWRTGRPGALSYLAAPGLHVILDAADDASLTASRQGEKCAVTVSATTAEQPQPLVASLDASCRITLDPEAAAASPDVPRPRPVNAAAPRTGCCAGEIAPGTNLGLGLVLGLLLATRRHRRPTRARMRGWRACWESFSQSRRAARSRCPSRSCSGPP